MLVLTRKLGERIVIGDSIVLTVVRINGDKVRLGIEAPPEIEVHREELRRRHRERPPASEPSPTPSAAASGHRLSPPH
jgi:carbon storage regulator